MKGFTLVELALVLVIIGLISGAALVIQDISNMGKTGIIKTSENKPKGELKCE